MAQKATQANEVEVFEKWAEEFERENPDVLYNGGLPEYEDPADYYGFSVKGARLA